MVRKKVSRYGKRSEKRSEKRSKKIKKYKIKTLRSKRQTFDQKIKELEKFSEIREYFKKEPYVVEEFRSNPEYFDIIRSQPAFFSLNNVFIIRYSLSEGLFLSVGNSDIKSKSSSSFKLFIFIR